MENSENNNIQQNNAEQSKSEQNNSEQNKAEQNNSADSSSKNSNSYQNSYQNNFQNNHQKQHFNSFNPNINNSNNSSAFDDRNNNLKPKSIFWGSLFVLSGLILLLKKFNLELNSYDESITNFWPLLLVFYGISFFKFPIIIRQINAFAGAVLMIVLFLNITSSTNKFLDIIKKSSVIKINSNKSDYDNLSDYTDVQKIIRDSSYNNSQLVLNAAAGEFQLYSNESDYIIEVKSERSGMGELLSSLDTVNKITSIIYNSGEHNGFKDGDNDRRGEFLLNPKSNWDIEANIGAGEFDFDLSGLQFKEFNLNAGAAEINLKVGQLTNNSNINIKSGATDITIRIPKELASQIITKTALSENDFENFINKGKNTYQTSNFSSNTNAPKLYITIDGGISSYKVETY